MKLIPGKKGEKEMNNNDDALNSRSKEQKIRKTELTVAMGKVSEATEETLEQKTAKDILTLMQNSDDFEDSEKFITLYIKALNNT
jgi:hypothetical protein